MARSAHPVSLTGARAVMLRIGVALRRETVGGLLLVGAAAIAVICASSPIADGYLSLRDLVIGYAPWHLDLTVGTWASDGLLAVFFFLVGLELKREFVVGDLRSPARALVPVAAAVGGVVVPAVIYLGVNAGGATHGWAVPTATDIAFAVAVLAVVGSGLPASLRLFLLTLAVVDDLIAIAIIAVVYTDRLELLPLVGAAVAVAAYGLVAQRFPEFFVRHRWAPWAILLPIGLLAWAFTHASGIHATVAGVVLGFTVPVRGERGLAAVLEHRIRPLSAGIAVPVFAFFSAGVPVGGDLAAVVTDPLALGVLAGLVLGKPIGIMAATAVVTRVTRAEFDGTLRWIDLLGVSMLAGIGFTVSLLLSELSFGAEEATEHAKLAVLTASVVAALLASIVLIARSRHYRRLAGSATGDGTSISGGGATG